MGVGERGVLKECLVGQGMEEGQQVGPVPCSQSEAIVHIVLHHGVHAAAPEGRAVAWAVSRQHLHILCRHAQTCSQGHR